MSLIVIVLFIPSIFVVTIGAAQTPVRISLSQMSRLMMGFDSFVVKKCQNNEKFKDNEKSVKECIEQMNIADLGQIFELNWSAALQQQYGEESPRTISRQSSIESANSSARKTPLHPNQSTDQQRISQQITEKFAADQKQQQQQIQVTADEFVHLMLKKMLKKLRKRQIKHIFQRAEKSATIGEEMGNLNRNQNSQMIFGLFYAANTLGNIFRDKITEQNRANVNGFGQHSKMIDFEYYEEMNNKFGDIFTTLFAYGITSESDSKKLAFLSRSKSGKALFWFNFNHLFSVTTEWQNSKENILAWKLKVKIASTKFGKIIRAIGQFVMDKCGKYLWNLTEQAAEIKHCAKRIDFTIFGRFLLENFPTNKGKEDDESFTLINLIVNFLYCETIGESLNRRWDCPYLTDVFERIETKEQKLCVLRGLLEFGHLFRRTLGNSATKITNQIPQINWKENISIIFLRRKNREEEQSLLKELMEKSGLMETMVNGNDRKRSGNHQREIVKIERH